MKTHRIELHGSLRSVLEFLDSLKPGQVLSIQESDYKVVVYYQDIIDVTPSSVRIPVTDPVDDILNALPGNLSKVGV